MRIGLPTHPRRDIIEEIAWIGEHGFDFADLFFEPDKGDIDHIEPKEVRKALRDYDLDSIGHTAWYLPIGSPCRALREKAVEILIDHVVAFAEIECRKVTVHANWPPGLFSEEEGIAYQTESLCELSERSKKYGITILYESGDTGYDCMENIERILSLNPDVSFHADIGHLNLYDRDPVEYLDYFRDRIEHVHLHDNNGLMDLHLPVGAGNIEWRLVVSKLKEFYDKTVTLEVFSREEEYILLSKRILESLLDE